jgi:deoxycytidylate deaminase
MQDKHIKIRMKQCLENAKASECVRAQYGAMVIDETRNVILSDGYNGGPRNGSRLCGFLGENSLICKKLDFCKRNGLKHEDFTIYAEKLYPMEINGVYIKHVSQPKPFIFFPTNSDPKLDKNYEDKLSLVMGEAKNYLAEVIRESQFIKSGVMTEIGCVHAEANAIINATNNGNAVKGASMFITGEPCLNCAKLIVNSEILKVYIAEGGYLGVNGLKYLEENNIKIFKIKL